ncbi:hypothetical protein ACE01N_01000 [Saccharicrinis sp. FJH2]|uniref:hypothetical protein n=1 Tax=Saccharicrinis sp. FJH65 TaxID=3344659 RepID=UPI0035F29E93
MTLISYTNNFGHPIICGDILITRKGGLKNLKLPTHLNGTLNFLGNQDAKPEELNQKIYVINKDLCVAVAGSLSRIYSFLNSAELFFHKEKRLEATDVERFISWFQNEKGFDNFSVLILHHLKDNGRDVFGAYYLGEGWQERRHNIFDDILACGSGASDYLKNLENFPEVLGLGKINTINKALSQNLNLLSLLLGYELIFADTIRNHYGAGFEVIYFENNEFKKLNNYTFIIWTGSFFDDELKMQPFRIMKYQYQYEVLLVRTTGLEKSDDIFFIVPINKEKEVYRNKSFTVPDFSSDLIISFFMIKTENNRIFNECILVGGEGNAGVFIEQEGKDIKVYLSSDFENDIKDRVKQLVKK